MIERQSGRHTVVHPMMAGRVDDGSQEPQVIHELRVDPELEQSVEFEVDQVDGRRQEDGQREIEDLSS